ncbi:MAG TPA: hypothetical protein VFO03_03685, partial [Gaiellaceae bacterium]|nr:hypothetical protein [Gaiellaceae bacterium]
MPRRLVAPISVAARRIVARPGIVALAAFGITLATAGLTTLVVGQVVVEDRAVADSIGRLPVEQRLIAVSWVGSEVDDPSRLDREARRAIRSLGFGDPVRAVAFRSTRFGTEVVRLAAVDDPAGLLEARQGHLPARCGPTRCELVALDAPGTPLRGTRLRVVGSATAAPRAPLGALVGATSGSERVFVANGIDGLARRPEMSGLFRTLTWAVPLQEGALDSRRAAALPRRVAEIDTALSQVSLGFAVQAPLDDLAGARDRALRASRRQLLVGGQCIVVFLAFAVLAASRIRRNAQETRFRLRRLRALRWQIGLETTAYALLVVLPAVLAGLVLGAVAGAAVASAAGRPAGDAVRRALDSQEMLLAAVLLAGVA